MSRVELGFRRLVAYTVGGVALLAFALILRALFTVQTQGIPTGADSPLQTPDDGTVEADPFGMTFFNEEGDDLEPAWSPDGRYIAFVSNRDNVSTVVIRDVSTNTVTPIASEAGHPVWSPDGTHLAYSRPNPQGGVDTYLTVPDGSQHVQVRLTNAVGGIWSPDSQSILFGTRAGEIHVVSLNGSTERTIPIQNLWALGVTDISPDGTQVLASAATRDPQGLTGMIRIDLEIGAVTELTMEDPGAVGGLWSPDGQFIAYLTSPPETTSIGIVRIMPAQGGEPHTITNLRPDYSVGQYDWSPNSRFVAYVAYPSASVIDGGELAVSWADGSRSVPLLPQSIVRTFSWSPDGSQIAAAVRNGDQFDIAIVRTDEASLLARLTALEATPEPGAAFTIRRLTTDPEDEYRPVVSPDGRTVAYARAPSGSYFGWDIYGMDLASGETQRLTDDPLDDFSPSWSPDGTRIAYQRMTSTPEGLAAVDWLVMNADGSDPKVISSGVAWSGEEPAAWSPDSSRVAFVDGGSIVVYNLEGPREVARFTPSPGGWYTTPTWLPDGRNIAFAGGNALMIGDSETGAVTSIASGGEFIRLPMWSDALSRLAFFSIDNRIDVRLISLRADGSDPLTLARFTSPILQNPAWSHDGRFIAYLGEDSLQVTVAWTDQYVDRPPLFTLPLPSILGNGPAGTTDLRGLSWLPASREPSFVFVDSRDGQPDLYLATLDEAGLEAYLAPLSTPTPVLPPAPSPSTAPTATPGSFPTLFPTPTPLRPTDFYWPSRLTNDPTGNYRPAVSPDGQRIAFASERDGNWDIYVLDRSSGAEARLTDDPDPDMAPSWSPDGARIAYQHNILDPSGPVLVDRTVMNADGSNKTVVAGGSVWTGNQPPAWSPDGMRIVFNDGRSVIVVNVGERREVARFTPLPGGVQAYLDPVWLDDSQVAFSADGQLTIGDLSSGAVTTVDGAPRFARLPMTTHADARIGYFALEGSSTRLITVLPDGDQPRTLVQVSIGFIQQAAWSPDGRFIAYYADDSVYLALASSEQYRDNAPLFAIPNVTTGLSDLVGLSWLPDSSGFVYVASSDGQPDLFLATLNQGAIQAYVDSYPLYAPAQVTRPAVTPPPPPTMTPFATPTPVSPPGDDRAATPTPIP